MTFEQLSYFLAIVKNKTFTAAAEDLYISQSSLSKGIKALEQELDCVLFNRGNKYVELTPAGRIFNNYAKKAEQNWLKMLNDIALLSQSPVRTEVSIGVLPIIDEMKIISHITDFQKSINSENTYINLVEGEQDELVKFLSDGKIDAAIVRYDELNPETFNRVTLLKNELVAVFPSGGEYSALCGKDSVGLSELAEHPFIEFDKSSYLSRKIRNAFEANGLMPRYSYSYKRHQQILSMVNAGYGIAIIPKDLVNYEKYCNIRSAALSEPLYTTTSLVWLRNAPQNKTVTMLGEFLSGIEF